MDPTVQAALIASISSLLGVLTGTVVSFAGQWYALRKQREQWERDRQAEYEKWLRDKLQEIYSNSIFYSRRSGFRTYAYANQTQNKIPELDVEYRKMTFEADKLDHAHEQERKKWLNLLMVYHPLRGTKEYDNFLEKFRNNKVTADDIIELANQDPRLKKDIGE